MIELGTPCYVPNCTDEGIYNASGGWMCELHYHNMKIAEIRWDAAQIGRETEEGKRLLSEADLMEKEFIKARNNE